MRIADIELGCVTFGREIDKKMSFRLMDHAVSLGIFSFDTAAAYGGGSSERIIGEWLRTRTVVGEKVKISTKVLPPYDRNNLFESVENCRQRLSKQTLNVLYLHRWDSSLLQPSSWEALAELIQEGKISQVGVSNFNFKQLNFAVEQMKKQDLPVSYLQNNHNLAVSDITQRIKVLCLRYKVKIVTYSPLGAGFLTGKHLNGVSKNSRFDIIPAHQNIYFQETALKKLKQLLLISETSGYPPSLLAMAWAIRQPFVDSVLVGGRSVEHLDVVFQAKLLDKARLIERLENECFRMK